MRFDLKALGYDQAQGRVKSSDKLLLAEESDWNDHLAGFINSETSVAFSSVKVKQMSSLLRPQISTTGDQ